MVIFPVSYNSGNVHFCTGNLTMSIVTGSLLPRYSFLRRTDPKFIKHFSCSTQLRLKFILLINVKIPTIVGILKLFAF